MVEQRIITKESIAHPEIIKIGGEKYQLHFKVVTICVLVDAVGNQIGTGATQWSPKEPFDFIRGKKLALRAAMSKSTFGKAMRAVIWNAFLTASRLRLEREIKEQTKMIKNAIDAVCVVTADLHQDRERLKRGVFGCAKR